MRVGFGLAKTKLGEVVVGATDDGVCCVFFADDEEPKELLASEFPNADVVHDHAGVATHLAAIGAAFDGEEPGLPLDLVGTPFQRLVWDELAKVPPGETVTYSQIAQRLGRPTSTRAVANACAANHVAVLVPCHRAVRSDGAIGGYRWGVERKRQLLEAEKRKAKTV